MGSTSKYWYLGTCLGAGVKEATFPYTLKQNSKIKINLDRCQFTSCTIARCRLKWNRHPDNRKMAVTSICLNTQLEYASKLSLLKRFDILACCIFL